MYRGGRLAALVLMVFAGSVAFSKDEMAMTNTVDVTAGGVLSEPVPLHRPVFAAWLADPDYNSWTNYTDGGVHHEFPLITKLVWDTPENAIYRRNLYPGRTYEWAVTNGGTVVKSGSFTTAANPPRWLLAEVRQDRNVNNFRDLGGWELPGGNGRRTNFDVFFRSANFDAYFESGDIRDRNPMHSEFGINTELDLRGGENIVTIPGDPADGIEGERYYYEKPHDKVEEVIGLGPENSFNTSPSVKDGSVRYFRVEMIVDVSHAGSSAAEEIRKAFHVLGTKAYHPVLFHCAAGRDRTGFIAFLIEALCGLREEQLYRDHLAIVFAAQGTMWSERIDGNIRSLYTALNPDRTPAYAGYGDSLAGHVRAYLESIGVMSEEIATITSAYAGETPDEVLARVDAWETAHDVRTVWYVSKETMKTNAVHRIGRDEILHPPLFGRYDHQQIYGLERPGYRFVGWTDERPVPGSTDTRIEALWESMNPGPGPGVSAWRYDAASMTVSDGEWMFGVSVSGRDLTLAGVYAVPDEPSPLDWAKPIVDADGAASDCRFVRIASGDPRNCLFGLAPEFRDRVSSVRFPDSLTEIGNCAFYKCTNLAGRVVLPEGLVAVPTNGFTETAVRQVVLPDSCARIDQEAFKRCKSLTNVVVGTGLKVLGNSAFNEASALASFSPGFPTSLERIGEYAFASCATLGGDLSLPSVTELPYKCFSGVPMTSLSVPSVTNVGREVVSSDVMTNVTFGVRAVSFIDLHDEEHPFGRSCFKAANPCRYVFPGKAPLLPRTGEGTSGGYTGSTGGAIFGTKSGTKTGGYAWLCGSWAADPTGWQKIVDDAGTPASEVTYTPPSLPSGWSVKGVFRFATSSTSVSWGWLLDDGFSGSSVTVHGVTIPQAWTRQYPDYAARFGSDFAASVVCETGKRDASGSRLQVWQDYVAGTDPTDASDAFRARIVWRDGEPDVSWSPSLSGRKYTVWGRTSLPAGDWAAVTKGDESDYRFFKVSVEMAPEPDEVR